MDLRFSIILPTYGRAYVLWRAIQSVMAQTEERWELLIVNDGSTDNTSRLLEELRDPRLRTFVTARQGASAARNFGVRQARAPYSAYLDSDNTWHAECLATVLSAIKCHVDVVLWYCGQHTTTWERDTTGRWAVQQERFDARAQYGAAEALQLQAADTNCIVHTRSLPEAIGGWDEACCFLEDWDFFARCILRFPNQVHWVPGVLVEYRQVYGVGVDGLCATIDQDPMRRRAQWEYLVGKWQGQPGSGATAQRLKGVHLGEL
jgi:glycosyltransferase involved in cell wall biosynthesis